MGYDVSKLVWSKLAFGLSAGRVQSVALRLIVDREREIQAFIKEEYWTIDLSLNAKKAPVLKARLAIVTGENPGITNEARASEIVKDLDNAKYTVQAVGTKGNIGVLTRHGQAALATRMGEEGAARLGALDDSPTWRGEILYNLACQFALNGDRAKALALLTESLSLQPGLREWSTQDADLVSLREDPAFLALVG